MKKRVSSLANKARGFGGRSLGSESGALLGPIETKQSGGFCEADVGRANAESDGSEGSSETKLPSCVGTTPDSSAAAGRGLVSGEAGNWQAFTSDSSAAACRGFAAGDAGE
jgi:hypothetical protein